MSATKEMSTKTPKEFVKDTLTLLEDEDDYDEHTLKLMSLYDPCLMLLRDKNTESNALVSQVLEVVFRTAQHAFVQTELLDVAAENGAIDIVRIIANDLGVVSSDALYFAVVNDEVGIVSVLLEADADVEDPTWLKSLTENARTHAVINRWMQENGRTSDDDADEDN